MLVPTKSAMRLSIFSASPKVQNLSSVLWFGMYITYRHEKFKIVSPIYYNDQENTYIVGSDTSSPRVPRFDLVVARLGEAKFELIFETFFGGNDPN